MLQRTKKRMIKSYTNITKRVLFIMNYSADCEQHQCRKSKNTKPLFMAKYSFQLNGQDISVPVLGMEKLQYSLSSYIRMTRQQMDRKEISKEQCMTLLENVLISL